MTDLAISLKGLTKRYGQREALKGLDLEVPTGSFFAVLGPNGAGKTTLLRSLVGMIRPDGGTGQILGFPMGPNYPPAAVKARLGYVAQQPALYDRMTAAELIGMCRGLHPRWDDRVVQRYVDLFGFPTKVQVRHLSPGMRSQMALTLVMGGKPDLLILDEPTLGLDPLNRHQYMQVLLADSMEAGRTVLLSTHDLYQIERMADRAVILRDGVAVAGGLVDDLKDTEKRARVAGTVTEQALRALPGVHRVQRESSGWLLSVSTCGADLRETLLRVPGVHGVQVYEQSLEEIFLSYVS